MIVHKLRLRFKFFAVILSLFCFCELFLCNFVFSFPAFASVLMCLPNFSYFFSPSFLATEDWCSLPSSPEEPYIPGKSGEHSAPLVLNQIKHFVSHGKIQFSLTGREHLLVSRKSSVNVHTFTMIYFILYFFACLFRIFHSEAEIALQTSCSICSTFAQCFVQWANL